jgi:hypothetical protein
VLKEVERLQNAEYERRKKAAAYPYYSKVKFVGDDAFVSVGGAPRVGSLFVVPVDPNATQADRAKLLCDHVLNVATLAPPIPHDLAHDLATAACRASDYSLALELLYRATKNGADGVSSSIRTANRIMNIRDRIARIAEGTECAVCNRPINGARWFGAPLADCRCRDTEVLAAEKREMSRLGKATASYYDDGGSNEPKTY